MLLAGYARGRCARLERDWAAACGGLAECAAAVEVRCRLIALMHFFIILRVLSAHHVSAVAGAAAARFSSALPMASQSNPPPPLPGHNRRHHLQTLNPLVFQLEIASEQLVACLLSSASRDELRRLAEMNVRGGGGVLIESEGACAMRVANMRGQAPLVEAASRIKAHAQAAGLCRCGWSAACLLLLPTTVAGRLVLYAARWAMARAHEAGTSARAKRLTSAREM